MIYYTREHEWVSVEDGTATVGISTYAADELGDITYIELPALGTRFKQGDTVSVVESVKAASDIYAPVSGVVCEVNESLADAPETINESAEDRGWIFRLNGADESELATLMDEAAYRAFTEEIKG